jgi:thiol-disulfide isomerase/thioredoxin
MKFITFVIFTIFNLLSCQGKSNTNFEHLSSSRSSVIFTVSTKGNNETWINIKSSYSLEPDVIRLNSKHYIDSAIDVSGQIVFSFGEFGNAAYFFEYSANRGDSININYDTKGFPQVKIISSTKTPEALQNLYYNINKKAIGINSLIEYEIRNLMTAKFKALPLPNPEKAVSNNLLYIDSLYSKGLINENTKTTLELRQYGFLSSYYAFKKDYKAFKYTFKEKLLPHTKLIDSAIYFKELFIYYVKILSGIDPDKNQFDYKKLASSSYTEYSTQLRDYLYYYLAVKSKSYQPKDAKEIKQIFLSNCKDSNLKNHFLESEIPQNKIQKHSSDILFDIASNEVALDSLLAIYKGKVIYLDLWASWCAPCIAEMPKSKELRDKYANKDVVFIFVSIDNNLKAWLNSQERLIPNKQTLSFVLADPKNSRISKQIKLNSVPRYLIYDKKGKLINPNAPSPTEILKTSIIDQYLNE